MLLGVSHPHNRITQLYLRPTANPILPVCICVYVSALVRIRLALWMSIHAIGYLGSCVCAAWY